MKPTTDSTLDTRRVVSTSLIVAITVSLTALSSRLLPHTLLGNIVALLAGALATSIAASPFEWLVHRNVYHRRQPNPLGRIYSIHQAHHHAYFPTSRYVTAGPPRRIQILGNRISASSSTLASALTRAAHFSFYLILGLTLICAPAWLLSRNVAFSVGTLCGLVIISDLFIRVHDAIHRPASHPFLQRQRWFRFLDEHHFIHHVDTSANVNFLLPLADLLYGTLRRSLTPEELQRHGTLQAAKAALVGCGEPVAGPTGAVGPTTPLLA